MNCIELYCSVKTLAEVAQAFGMSVSGVRYKVLKAGKLRSISEALKVSEKFRNRKGVGNRSIRSPETLAKMAAAQLGKGVGVSLKPSGYIAFTTGENKGRSVHCVLMEESIGRGLFANEVVHHIDGNRSNNDLKNLSLMTRKDHAQLHAAQNTNKRNRDKKGRYRDGRI